MFDYIVSCFFGDRRSQKINNLLLSDKFFLIKEHLNFIDENSHILYDINKIIFSINGVSDELLNDLQILINNYSFKEKIQILTRENTGFSYAAWNFALENRLKDNTEATYAFLCEDDYVPCDTNFYNIFINYFKDDVAYVCQLYTTLSPKVKAHPAISNGFISYEATKKIYSQFNTIFQLKYENTYHSGEINQINFLNFFENYIFLDITDNYFSRFLHLETVIIYGNQLGKEIIKPII